MKTGSSGTGRRNCDKEANAAFWSPRLRGYGGNVRSAVDGGVRRQGPHDAGESDLPGGLPQLSHVRLLILLRRRTGSHVRIRRAPLRRRNSAAAAGGRRGGGVHRDEGQNRVPPSLPSPPPSLHRLPEGEKLKSQFSFQFSSIATVSVTVTVTAQRKNRCNKLLTTFCYWQVGAPPEIASLLEEIRRENDLCKRDVVSTCFGADPELDEFMVMVPPAPPQKKKHTHT